MALLEKTLEESAYDLECAIKSLSELHLGYAKINLNVENGATPTIRDSIPSMNAQPQNNVPADKAEWADLFVTEMMSCSTIDEAKVRAVCVLERLEKSISSRSSAEAEGLHKENVILKEQIEALIKTSAILKRAVTIQHERQKEYDERNQEVLRLKQLVAQYQEQIRTLEVNNYALTLHLRQADQQNNSIPGRFHPDIF